MGRAPERKRTRERAGPGKMKGCERAEPNRAGAHLRGSPAAPREALHGPRPGRLAADSRKGCTSVQCPGEGGTHEHAVPWRGRDARERAVPGRREGMHERAGPGRRDGMRRRDARACRAQRRRDARTCRARSRGSPPTGPTGGSPGSPAWASTGGETCGGQPEWMHEHAAPPGRKGCTIVPGLEGRGRTGVQGPAA